jgi:prepilin signal peptidase PulO-like enzyme (type II secretory pathway)
MDGAMHWFFIALVAVAVGPVIYWLSRWAPHHIERQESEWISDITGSKPAITFPPPAPLWRRSYWAQAVSAPLFWVSTLGAVAVVLLFYHQFAGRPFFLGLAVFGLAVLCLAITDAYSQLLPDNMTLSLMWIGLLAQRLPSTKTVGIEAAVIGAAAGYLLLWLVARLFSMFRKQEGLGYGDMKLMAAAGAWLGPLALPGAIVIGSAMAVLFQGARMALGKSSKSDLFAFGPWLAAGILIAAIAI